MPRHRRGIKAFNCQPRHTFAPAACISKNFIPLFVLYNCAFVLYNVSELVLSLIVLPDKGDRALSQYQEQNQNRHQNQQQPYQHPQGTPTQNQPPVYNNDAGDLGRQVGQTVRDILQSIAPVVQTAMRAANENIRANAPHSTPPQRQHTPPAKPSHYGGLRPAQQTLIPMQRKGPSNFSGVPAIVLGTIGSISFGIGALALGILAAAGSFVMGMGSVMLTGLFAGLTTLSGLSGLLIGAGVGKRKRADRVRRYYAVAGDKGVASLPQLAAAVNLPEAKVKKDIRKAIQLGMMPAARMDAAETCLIVGEQAYQMYLTAESARIEREKEDSERERLLQDPDTAAMERFKVSGREALRRIREANDAIPGREVSEKMDQLESTAAKIFSYVEAHPEKLPETRKLMEYYLPTTLKLLEKYRQYEEMEFPPSNVQKTKKEIEGSLDTVNIAFENLLESLFQDDTLDVSTDIDVLQTMLRQEGLAGRRFTIKTDDHFRSTIEEVQQ